MDELRYGSRNKRGDWTPSAYLTIAPSSFFRLGLSPS
jgi:hypothetical protein